MLQLITKLPRVEKFNIGNEYKLSMYEMLRNIMYLSKIEKSKCLEIANNIDAELNTQRIYLIIMKNNKWIDERKFKIAMEQIYEIGKILGGLIKYYAKLTYENLMEAHIKSRKGKGYRKEIIEFNLKQEEYIMWLLEQLQTQKYKHGGYTAFYVTKPKLRKIEKSRYIDRIVHRWIVDNFLEPIFVPQFLNTTYACLKNKGMHRACLYVQNTIKHCKRTWGEYYILKMDIAKYFASINKEKLDEIISRKIKDEDVLWLLREIIYSKKDEVGIPIRKFNESNFCKCIL